MTQRWRRSLTGSQCREAAMVYIGAVLLVIGSGILIQPVVKQFFYIQRYSVKVRAVCTGQKPYVNYLNLKMKMIMTTLILLVNLVLVSIQPLW